MKHTKKWLKITASTLALTGAIATPIALTSCSDNENGPVDPINPEKEYGLDIYISKNQGWNGTEERLTLTKKSSNSWETEVRISSLGDQTNDIWFAVLNDQGQTLSDGHDHNYWKVTIKAPTDWTAHEEWFTQYDNEAWLGNVSLPSASSLTPGNYDVTYTIQDRAATILEKPVTENIVFKLV